MLSSVEETRLRQLESELDEGTPGDALVATQPAWEGSEGVA